MGSEFALRGKQRKFDDAEALAIIDDFIEGGTYTTIAENRGTQPQIIRAVCRCTGAYQEILDLLNPGKRNLLETRVDEVSITTRRSDAKLDDNQAHAIIRSYIDGKTAVELSREYGVSRGLITQITSGHSYPDIVESLPEAYKRKLMLAGLAHVRTGVSRAARRKMKLSEHDVGQIRGIIAWFRNHPFARGANYSEIGKRYGVSRETVRLIGSGTLHAWVEATPWSPSGVVDEEE